jgi:two-component system LytT family response regulator
VTRPITVVVIDDEPLARVAIKEQLQSFPGVAVVGEASDGREAVKLIKQSKPDIAFIDIKMPTLSGFEVVQETARYHLPVIVFVTAFDEYALRAFEAHAVDYLVKPFSVSRFRAVVENASLRASQASQAAEWTSLRRSDLDSRTAPRDPSERLKRYVDRFVVQSRKRIFFLQVDDVDWFESAGNYVIIHASGQEYMNRTTMNQLEHALDPGKFARIHRETIVQKTRVREIAPTWHDFKVSLSDGSLRNMSRKFRDRLLPTKKMMPGD